MLQTNNSPIKPIDDAGIDPFEHADDVSVDNEMESSPEYDSHHHNRDGSPSDFGLRQLSN